MWAKKEILISVWMKEVIDLKICKWKDDQDLVVVWIGGESIKELVTAHRLSGLSSHEEGTPLGHPYGDISGQLTTGTQSFCFPMEIYTFTLSV